MTTPAAATDPAPFHARDAAAVAADLAVDPAVGLADAEAARRAADAGPNALEEAGARARLADDPSRPRPSRSCSCSPSPACSRSLLGEVRDGLLVLVGLLPIVGADVVTEYRGERALEALRDASAPRARVRRDGAVDDVAAASLVPGDVVLLRAGDVVPADLRLLRADRLLARPERR